MRKSVLLVLFVCLIVVFAFYEFFNKPTEGNAQTKRDDIAVNGKPVKGPAFEEDSILAEDLDSIDIEIKRHGYHPSTKQERDALRKSYLIARDGADAMLTFHVTDYIMLNAAVAQEAYRQETLYVKNMQNSHWDKFTQNGYPNLLFASEWHKLFKNDPKFTLQE